MWTPYTGNAGGHPAERVIEAPPDISGSVPSLWKRERDGRAIGRRKNLVIDLNKFAVSWMK